MNRPVSSPNSTREKEAKFLAVMDEFDRTIGMFLDDLDKAGMADNTLVLFVGDNGAAAPFFGTRRTLGRRGMKFSLYEGGIWEAALARWPGRIPAGTVNKETVMHGIDFLPTFASIAGAKLDRKEQIDGEDLSGAFFGKTPVRKKMIFWEYGRNDSFFYPAGRNRSPGIAVREDRWKLLVNKDGSRVELYDIEADPFEQTNLIDKEKELTARLKGLALKWFSSLPTYR